MVGCRIAAHNAVVGLTPQSLLYLNEGTGETTLFMLMLVGQLELKRTATQATYREGWLGIMPVPTIQNRIWLFLKVAGGCTHHAVRRGRNTSQRSSPFI